MTASAASPPLVDDRISSPVPMLADLLLQLAGDVERISGQERAERLAHLLPRSRSRILAGTTTADMALAEIRQLLEHAERLSSETALQMREGASTSSWPVALLLAADHCVEVWRNEAAVVALNAAFHELVTLAERDIPSPSRKDTP